LENTEYHQYNEQSIICEKQLIERSRKKTISVQEERKKDQEHKILNWFTLSQGLRPVLCQLAKSSTKKITKIRFTQITTLATHKQPLLPTVNNLLNLTIVI